jgi:hypothetical protein
MSDAWHDLTVGNKYPYDAGDAGRKSKAKDWAHKAARGIMCDLCDRGVIKHAFAGIELETRKDIVASMAAIIRLAAKQDEVPL